MLRRLKVIAAVYALSVMVTCSAFAETSAVEFAVKLQPGEALWYALTLTVKRSLQTGDKQTMSQAAIEGYEVVRVLDVDRIGTMLIEITQENLRVDGRPQERMIGPAALKVVPTGQVVERVYGPLPEFFERMVGVQGLSEPDEFPMPMPPGRVQIGNSWEREADLTGQYVTHGIRHIFTLVGLERASDETLARIRVQSEYSTDLDPARGAKDRGKFVLQGSGQVLWSLERGRIVHASDEVILKIDDQASASSLTTHISRERLLREPPALPSITPDLLVRPGRGIGPNLLEEPVAAITVRLGAPVTEPDARFRSTRLRWSNGLIGHVDPADPTRLVGLEVTDRRYRTDKGIGFGSTEGAALVAHGLNPVRADATSVRLGGARGLVYQDQGLAFLVLADSFGTALRGGRAPANTVETVLVFPPGAAAKILHLP